MTTKHSIFKIGDIVAMKDDFHFNPAYKVISVGRVESIHFHQGKGLFMKEDLRGQITYSVSGFSLRPKESQLSLWQEKTKS